MSDSQRQFKGSVFDLGTSPHGLSAESRRTDEKTRPAENPDSLADGFDLAIPGGRACDDGGSAQGEHHVFAFTEEQRDHISFAVLTQIFELEESEEADEPDVMDALSSLCDVHHILEQGRPK